MIKRFFLPLFVLFSLATSAQQGTASPYSFYGIGDVKFKGVVENRLMGGVSVFPDSIHINLQNPASYSSLKLTTFTVGSSFSSGKYTTYQGEEKAQRTTLDYLAVGVPINKKLGAVFGLLPYSSVGYRVRTQSEEGAILKYSGSGGLNKVFLGAAYKFTPNLSVGLDAAYNFGEIRTIGMNYLPGLEYGTQEINKSDLSGFSFNLGAMYKRKIKNKYDFYGSLAYTPQSNLKLNNERYFGTIYYIENYDPPFNEFLDVRTSTNTIKMPSKFSAGAGFGQDKKWLIGTEVVLQQSSNFGNRFNDIANASYENGVKYSFGGYYIPNYMSFSSYFSRVVYRAGFRYENTGLVVNDEKIKDYAFTGGFGFPLGGTFSNLNIGVEYGRRGTAKANLVEENYTNVFISLSLNDQWFIRRKYD
ncbi:hypothetical protein [Flavobacterium sp.]|uniref:hypothetical protein n=1 Tax=Flavobacterium sp. TaxID=239 RepID=UPI0039E6F183